ncbi:mitochondrial import receptor subunit TOM22 homolog [Dreissena polymorpha]|uniref:Mitochondrial import receptor subunit TOM22 homolog n=1 Tax=Dreissena polymorpha TaxID=45954 RepID=A0A9D4M4K8_DREPO|nr:mitochondrial import receptor subunit TOM22 homolog [Dreissena polymorpha]KAH3869695.1 hypothetical protein DPMN_032865 [Dreissena polymorpha]
MTEQLAIHSNEEDKEDFVDESIAERLWGLTEMFPETVQNACGTLAGFTWNSTKACYKFSRTAVWTATSIFAIMFLPVLFEHERASMAEQQLQQQRQILLGPNAAMSGGMGSSMPHAPGLMPPPPQ